MELTKKRQAAIFTLELIADGDGATVGGVGGPVDPHRRRRAPDWCGILTKIRGHFVGCVSVGRCLTVGEGIRWVWILGNLNGS